MGTLRGSGEEKAAGCFCGVLVDGVGVVIVKVELRRGQKVG